jgi:hypothetical protein
MTTEELKKAAEYLKRDIVAILYRFEEMTGVYPEVEVITRTEKTSHCQKVITYDVIVKVLID